MKKTVIVLIMVFSLISLAHPSTVNAQIVHATPSFVYSPLTPRVGDVVSFDSLWWEKYWNENHEPRTFSYSWNFGDGTFATGVTVNHSYTKPGTYAVGVTVDDNLGTGGGSEMEIEVMERTPVTVHISLSSDSVYTGQEIIISGNLTYDGIGVPNAWVILSSKTYIDNAMWNEIASVQTDGYGKYLTVWEPLRGSYQVKASWMGNSTYPETSVSVNLGVKSFGDFITAFSSNSTITNMNFNSTTRVLSFSAEGPSETTGYVNIILEKDPTFNPQGIVVLLDGHPIDYNVESREQSWILDFIYTHSIHDVIVNLDTDTVAPSEHQSEPEPFPTTSAVASIVSIAIIGVGLMVYFKKRHPKTGDKP
jgi:PKD repeat protein